MQCTRLLSSGANNKVIAVAPFVALTCYLDGLLWTGDRRLASGLHKKGFIQTISTTQLSAFYNELQHRSRMR